MLRRGFVFLALVLTLAFVSCEQPGNGGDPVNAGEPSITGQPQGGAWNVTTADTFSLTVTANVTDGGTLSYRWYENTTNSTTGGTLVSNDTSVTFDTGVTLTLQKANYFDNQDYYFYVVVTNTISDNGDGGRKTAAATSNAAKVTVSGNLVNAQQPKITTQPQGGTWNVFAADTLSLTVGASVTDGGTLSYQWYATVGPAILSYNNPITSGGTSATLILNRENYTTDGVRSYFFVEIKNTNPNVNGIQTAAVTSSIVTVAVTGNGEFAYEAAPVPQDLIGQWIAYETITISATEFFSQMQMWGGYGGNVIGHRSNGEDAGYITIQYTKNDNDPGAIGKYYVIHYKELGPSTMWYSGAFSSSDPGFSGGGGGKTTQEEAEKTYTVTGGYFDLYTLVAKVP